MTIHILSDRRLSISSSPSGARRYSRAAGSFNPHLQSGRCNQPNAVAEVAAFAAALPARRGQGHAGVLRPQ